MAGEKRGRRAKKRGREYYRPLCFPGPICFVFRLVWGGTSFPAEATPTGATSEIIALQTARSGIGNRIPRFPVRAIWSCASSHDQGKGAVLPGQRHAVERAVQLVCRSHGHAGTHSGQ